MRTSWRSWQRAEALDFAHERRLLHRDVKPANILVTAPTTGARRRVLLTDFGIAREADDVDGITEAGMAIGTVAYAAPEQLLSKPLDGRVDQYALAATAFQLLTGKPPFEHSNRAVVVGNHLNTPPPRLSDRRADLAHLDAVMSKALAKNPGDRYSSCSEFAQALQHPAASPHPAATPPPPAPGAPDTHTAAFDVADDRGPSTTSHTKRLEVMPVHGTAQSVQKRPIGPGQDEEVWLFRVERYASTGQAHTAVPVELRGSSIAGQLSDGDVVEVHGIWDGGILLADSVVNQSAATRGRRRSTSPAVNTGDTAQPPARNAQQPARITRKARIVIVAVVMAVVTAVVASAIVLTGGFGVWSDGGGPIVMPARATVFSPGGSPDHPGEAGLAIDDDPDTSWSTDTYVDAKPFPTFKQGVGLLLELPKPTALSAVTIDVTSTGTEVQIRAADSATPSGLSDTTELTRSVPLQPGSNTIAVDNQTQTADVLVWITTLGTTDGKSRTAVSGITLQAAG